MWWSIGDGTNYIELDLFFYMVFYMVWSTRVIHPIGIAAPYGINLIIIKWISV